MFTDLKRYGNRQKLKKMAFTNDRKWQKWQNLQTNYQIFYKMAEIT